MADLLQALVERQPNKFTPLSEIRTAANSGTGLGGVYAYVEPNFDFVHQYENDWVVSDTARKLWRFKGKALILRVKPRMFLPKEFEMVRSVLTPIVRHEDVHVADAEGIVRQLLPAALRANRDFERLYLRNEPIPNEFYEPMIKFKQIDEVVSREFAKLWNAKVGERDSAASYHPVAAAVQAALARETNLKRR
jgi:hypothetical protein